MYTKYDSLDRFEPLTIMLCNPGSVYKNGAPGSSIGILSNISDCELVSNFNQTSELNFVVHSVAIDDPAINSQLSKLYEGTQPRRLVFAKGIGYFAIVSVEEQYNESNERYKDVHAVSIEQELADKKIPFIKDGTYRFVSDSSGKNGIMEGLMGTLPLWALGHIDEAVSQRYRTFEDVSLDLNILGFLIDEVQEAYECIFIFDTINRRINVYDKNNYSRRTDIHITKDDLINSVNITEDSNDIYTAMSVVGDGNVLISPVNPLGTNTLYDFSNYLDWMSEGLRTKVVSWQKAIKDMESQYYEINLSYYNKLNEIYLCEQEVERLGIQSSLYRRCRDNMIAERGNSSVKEYSDAIVKNGGAPLDLSNDLSVAIEQIDNLAFICDSKISNEKARLDRLNSELVPMASNIDKISHDLSFRKFFTETELAELNNYIFEGNYSDDYVIFTDQMAPSDKFEQMKILYDRAKSTLDKSSKPTQEFDLDVENFIFVKEFERWSEQLEVGCLINVELSDNDIALLFLTSISVNYDDHTLSMTFGNRFSKFGAKALFEDVLGKIGKSSNTLGFIKETILPMKNGEFNEMQEALETSRDLTLDAIIASSDEEVIIDGTGYTGRKKAGDGRYDPRQIKINGRNILFTDDAWDSCKVAIGELILGEGSSAYGINAQTIIGDMIIGNNLKILDNQGRDMFSVVDGKITAVVSDYDKRFSEIEATANGLEIEVSELAKKSGKSTEVVTTTGYKFNDDGLTIHKSGNEMTNLMDNTGMYVKRSGTTILSANNEGVDAINLTAHQYLHMGKYSRFEDYANDKDKKRTACFYIPGE